METIRTIKPEVLKEIKMIKEIIKDCLSVGEYREAGQYQNILRTLL